MRSPCCMYPMTGPSEWERYDSFVFLGEGCCIQMLHTIVNIFSILPSSMCCHCWSAIGQLKTAERLFICKHALYWQDISHSRSRTRRARRCSRFWRKKSGTFCNVLMTLWEHLWLANASPASWSSMLPLLVKPAWWASIVSAGFPWKLEKKGTVLNIPFLNLNDWDFCDFGPNVAYMCSAALTAIPI